MPGCGEDSIQKAAFAVLLVLAETWARLVLPYRQYPWRLVGLVDPRLSLQQKEQICKDFLSSAVSQLDLGFSQRLRSVVTTSRDLLEEGNLRDLIHLLSFGKIVNVEIEDNFARAAAMRRAGAGRPYSQPASAAKHVLAELKASHLSARRKQLSSVRKVGKKPVKAKPQKKQIGLVQDRVCVAVSCHAHYSGQS